jgi:hypothetical protein
VVQGEGQALVAGPGLGTVSVVSVVVVPAVVLVASSSVLALVVLGSVRGVRWDLWPLQHRR